MKIFVKIYILLISSRYLFARILGEYLQAILLKIVKMQGRVCCQECGYPLYLQKSAQTGKQFWLCKSKFAHGKMYAMFTVTPDGGVGEHCEIQKPVSAPCPHPKCNGTVLQIKSDENQKLFWHCLTCKKEGRCQFYHNINNAPYISPKQINAKTIR